MFTAKPKSVSAILASFELTINALLLAEAAHNAIADKKEEEGKIAAGHAFTARGEATRAGLVAAKFKTLVSEQSI